MDAKNAEIAATEYPEASNAHEEVSEAFRRTMRRWEVIGADFLCIHTQFSNKLLFNLSLMSK